VLHSVSFSNLSSHNYFHERIACAMNTSHNTPARCGAPGSTTRTPGMDF
jgi:hypothetical protein